MGKSCELSSSSIFDRIFFILQGNQNNHKILDRFEIQQDPTWESGVSCPWASEEFPIDL